MILKENFKSSLWEKTCKIKKNNSQTQPMKKIVIFCLCSVVNIRNILPNKKGSYNYLPSEAKNKISTVTSHYDPLIWILHYISIIWETTLCFKNTVEHSLEKRSLHNENYLYLCHSKKQTQNFLHLIYL